MAVSRTSPPKSRHTVGFLIGVIASIGLVWFARHRKGKHHQLPSLIHKLDLANFSGNFLELLTHVSDKLHELEHQIRDTESQVMTKVKETIEEAAVIKEEAKGKLKSVNKSTKSGKFFSRKGKQMGK